MADRAFMDLAQGLQESGLSGKVIADMFGLTLRAYQIKLRRVRESGTMRNRSLWEAVYNYIAKQKTVPRAELLKRFSRDDSASVASVLQDLLRSGTIEDVGQGKDKMYRVLSQAELASSPHHRNAHIAIIWSAIFGSGSIYQNELAAQFPTLNAEALEELLSELEQDGRISRVTEGTQVRVEASHFLIPMNANFGKESAMLDHFRVVSNTICAKMNSASSHTMWSDYEGGSTYHFDITPDHPLREEVLAHLKEAREKASELRAKVDAYNQSNPQPKDALRVSFYVGQYIVEDVYKDALLQKSTSSSPDSTTSDKEEQVRTSDIKKNGSKSKASKKGKPRLRQ